MTVYEAGKFGLPIATGSGRLSWNSASGFHDDILVSVMVGCFYAQHQTETSIKPFPF